MPAGMTQLESHPVVRVDRVNHYFGEGDTRNQVLFDNCIEIGAGQLVIMTGPSGSGKTSLLTLIGALRSVQEGTIQVLGRNLTGMPQQELVAIRRNIGFIFQAHNLFDSLSAYENVKMAMQLGGGSASEMRQRGVAMLERLGLGHRVDYKPRALSGGQRQRVAVARALVNRPKLILADEPTASLDKESSSIVVHLLKELTVEEGCAVIMVSHDNRILELADRIVNMVDGSIVSDVVLRDMLMICEVLKTVEVFKNLTPSEIAYVAERMKKRRFARDEIVIRQGEVGQEFFLIVSGAAAVTVQRPGGPERQIDFLRAGQVFGETALLTDEPRNATVRVAEDMEIFVLGKRDFRAAVELSAGFKDQVRQVYFARQANLS
jgi:putative ABC transport system ATP-binding protein